MELKTSMAAMIFNMDLITKQRILSKRRIKNQQRLSQHSISHYQKYTYEDCENIVCHRCKEIIELLENVATVSSKYRSKHYHERCARAANIIL